MKTQRKNYEIDMCHGPILKKMLLFALPLMASGLLQLLFNAADIVMLGQFGTDDSMGSVGATGPLVNLVTNLFIGLSVGTNVLVARYYSTKQDRELSRTLHASIFLALASGIVLTVVGVCFAGTFLGWMGTPEENLPLATLYLRIYFAGMLATMLYNFGAAALRGIGDTRRPLYYLMFAGVINVLLNLVFVVGFRMDIAGVAIATVISQIISATLVIRCLLLEKGAMHLSLRLLRFDGRKLLEIARIGVPAGIQGTIFALSNVVIQSSVNLFGNTIVNGNSVAQNLEGFVWMAMNTFYQATLSFVSQNYGVGDFARVKRCVLTGLGCVMVTGLVLGNGVFLFGRQLGALYSSTPEVIDAAMRRLAWIVTVYFLCGIMDVMVGAIRGIGYSVLPMIVSLVGVCGTRLVWIATVFRMPKYHTTGSIYITYPISWSITFAVHVICFTIVYRKVRRKYGKNECDAIA